MANPLIRTRFEAAPDLDHAKKMAVEFFCAGCGGPESYTGRDSQLDVAVRELLKRLTIRSN